MLSISLLIIILVNAGVLSVILGYIYKNKASIPCMTGMMIAMTLGMMIGLLAGVIAGVILAGNLFVSTIIGMLIGMLIGFTAGAPISVMSILDGMMAGIMGGMMGAMVGDMIAPTYQGKIINIFFVLTIGILLILIYMIQQELPIKNGRTKWFCNPIIIVLVTVAFFTIFNQLDPTYSYGINLSDQDSKIHNHVKQSNEENNLAKIMVEATEFSFIPKELKVQKGQKITLELKNEGKVEHDLEIIGLQAEIATSNTTHHYSDPHNVHVHANAGEIQEITFIPTTSGVYQMICTLPGHKEAGMEGIIIVN